MAITVHTLKQRVNFADDDNVWETHSGGSSLIVPFNITNRQVVIIYVTANSTSKITAKVTDKLIPNSDKYNISRLDSNNEVVPIEHNISTPGSYRIPWPTALNEDKIYIEFIGDLEAWVTYDSFDRLGG